MVYDRYPIFRYFWVMEKSIMKTLAIIVNIFSWYWDINIAKMGAGDNAAFARIRRRYISVYGYW